MNDDEKRILTKRMKYFFENKIKVHIKKNNGFFYNGLILELEGDLLIIDDEKNKAMPIYIEEIKDIEKRREKV